MNIKNNNKPRKGRKFKIVIINHLMNQKAKQQKVFVMKEMNLLIQCNKSNNSN